MYPKYSYKYELSWTKNGKIYTEQLGSYIFENVVKKLKKLSDNNGKLISHLSTNVNKFGYIIEFDGVEKDNNIYIDTGDSFQTFITKKGLEIEFICYLYDFKEKKIKIYKCNYIYSQDIILMNEINNKTGKVKDDKNVIITNPKKEKLIDKIGGNYHKLIVFLKEEILDWYNNVDEWIGD